MKTNKILLVSLFFIAVLSACKKDKATEPDATVNITIKDLEVGYDNNKEVYVGNDLHINALIEAPDVMSNVKLEITPVSGNGWKYEQTYTYGFEGFKDGVFHKHIVVPTDAVAGNYKLVLTVTDKNGKSKKVESDLKIQADSTAPSITGLKVEFENNNELHVEGTMAAPSKIAKVVVEIHNQKDKYEKEFTFTDVAMVGKTTYKFHQHIDIPQDAPNGEYHVHVKLYDQTDRAIEAEEHFEKK